MSNIVIRRSGVPGPGSDVLQPLVDDAEAAADRSEAAATESENARDIAQATAQYPSLAAAQAAFPGALVEGEVFSYNGPSGLMMRGKIIGGIATELEGPYIGADKIGTSSGGTVQGDLNIASVQGLGRLRGGSLASFTAGPTNPDPVKTIGDTLYGWNGGNLYGKTSRAGAWALVTAVPTSPIILELMSDGEVVLVGSTQVYKSTGWGSGTVTWTLKVTNSDPAGNSAFLKYSSAGTDGVKMIVGEYAGNLYTGGAEDSIKCWATTDSGDNWTIVWNSQTQFPSDYNNTHIHGCCYDAAQDLFLVIEGHTSSRGVYYSPADLGSISWTRIEKGEFGQLREDGQPTTIVPCAAGIVLASDSPDQGLWVIERGASPSDMRVEYLLAATHGEHAVAGFGQVHAVDPLTGVVYIGMRVNYQPGSTHPLEIYASNGGDAIVAWRGDSSTIPSDSLNNAFGRLVVTPWRTVIAKTFSSSEIGEKALEANILNFGAKPVLRGNVMGGIADGTYTLACGGSSEARAIYATAVGNAAKATADNSTIVGSQAKSNSNVNSTVVGSTSEAMGASVTLLGYGLKAGNNSVIVGSNRDLSARSSVTSIGVTQTITVNSAVAVGHSVTVSGANSTAIGTLSQATGSQSTVLGASAQASGANSFAAGHVSIADGSSGTAVGQSSGARGTSAIALGRGAIAPANSIVIGVGRDLFTGTAITGSVSIGVTQTISGLNSVTVGNNTTNAGLNGVALGPTSSNSASGGVALGSASTVGASHTNSVALGSGTSTTALGQVAVGAKHIELSEISTPAAPATNSVRLFARDTGGKTELCALFPTGAVVVLGVEP